MPRMIVRNSWGGDLVKECLCRDVFNALFTISGLSSIERRQVCELLKRVKMEVVFAKRQQLSQCQECTAGGVLINQIKVNVPIQLVVNSFLSKIFRRPSGHY